MTPPGEERAWLDTHRGVAWHEDTRKLAYVLLTQLREVEGERDSERAAAERLRKGLDGALAMSDRYEKALAQAEQRVAGLGTVLEKIATLANGLSTRLKGTPEMYEANKIMHEVWAGQAALTPPQEKANG